MTKEGPKREETRRLTKKELEAKLAESQQQLGDKEKRIGELLNKLAYQQAELENLRKRVEKERQQLLRYASEAVVRNLLPIVDEFELALNSMKDRDDDFSSGIRMIYDNLMKLLRTEGVKEIEADGMMFDPYLHEAVSYVEGAEGDGKVVRVLQKGYRLEDRILRPSQVVVSRKGGEPVG